MLYLIVMGIMALCIAIFAVQNAVMVEVSFLFWHFSMSLALIILGSLVIGFMISGLIALKVKTTHYMKERKLKGEIKELKQQATQRSKDRPVSDVPRFTAPRPHSTYRPGDDDKDPIIKPFNPEK
jgi:putative membrane protein